MMRKIFLAIVAVCCLAMANAQERTKEVSSTINEVTMYLYGATVSRNAQVDIEAGVTRLVLTGLSYKLDSRSIQAGLGTDVSILSVSDNAATYINQKKLPILKFLSDSIEAAKFQLETEKNTAYVLEQELGLLLANKNLGDDKGVVVAEVEEGLFLYRKELPEIKRKMLLSSIRLKKLQVELDTLNNRYTEFKRNNEQQTREIHITVSATQRTQVNLSLQYYVPDAAWLPKYDIRTLTLTDPINVTYKAELKQNTGENWEGVKVVLSTNNPMYSGNLPQLYTKFIDLNNLYQQNGTRFNMDELNSYNNAKPGTQQYDDMGYRDNIRLQSSVVNSDLRFEIPFMVKLASDNQSMVVEVKKATLPVAYKYFTVPKVETEAFLKAQVTGWEDLNMLNGDANLYLEGTFLGKTYINPDQLDDTLSLYMGKDRRVVVKRTKVKEMSGKNFFGNKITQSVVWEIEVKNNKKEAIQLEIQDQIPVSKNDDLEVQKDDMGGATVDAESGLLTWNRTLQPGETVKIRFSFSIKYPKSSKVTQEKLRELRRDNYM